MSFKNFILEIGYIIVIFILLVIIVELLQSKANAQTIDCNKHKIYCHIDQLRPMLDFKYKMQLSNIIHKYAKQYKVNPHISVAILMQENRFKNNHRYEYVDLIHEDGTIEEVRGITDYGIAQIHRATIRNYNFDIQKLLDKDLDYTIKCHMRILSEKKALCKNMVKPWACYHSKTTIIRNQYIPLVERYFNVGSN